MDNKDNNRILYQKQEDVVNQKKDERLSSVMTDPVEPEVQQTLSNEMGKGAGKKGIFQLVGKKTKIGLVLFGLVIFFLLMFFVGFLKNNISRLPSLLGKKGEIVWWGIKEDEEMFSEIIKSYQEKNPDVRITFVKQSEKDYAERLYNSLAKGNAPDIFEIHNTWIPEYSKYLDKLPSKIMSQEEYAKTFLPVIFNTLNYSKGIVGFPLYYDGLTLYINNSVFASAGYENPETWDDLIASINPKNGVLNLNKKGELIQSAIGMGTTKNTDYWQDIIALLLIQNRVDLRQPNTQRANDVLAFYALFLENENWSNNFPSSTIAFARGKSAMLLAKTETATEILRENPNLKFSTINLPQLPKNTADEPQYSYASFYFQAVWNRSTNKDIVWDFLKYLTLPENLKKINEKRKTLRAFEMPYPRNEMLYLQEKDPVLGSVIADSKYAKTWYLADKSPDMEKGINSQLTSIYKTAVDGRRFSDENLLLLKETLTQFEISLK